MASENRQTLRQNTLQNQASQSGQIWEARQDARDQIVDQFDTVDDPGDIGIDTFGGGAGVGPSQDFLSWATPREVAHDLDAQYPETDIGPQDVAPFVGGFGLEEGMGIDDTRRVDPQESMIVEMVDDGIGGPGAEAPGLADPIREQQARDEAVNAAKKDIANQIERDIGIEANPSEINIDLDTGDATLAPGLERRIEALEGGRGGGAKGQRPGQREPVRGGDLEPDPGLPGDHGAELVRGDEIDGGGGEVVETEPAPDPFGLGPRATEF